MLGYAIDNLFQLDLNITKLHRLSTLYIISKCVCIIVTFWVVCSALMFEFIEFFVTNICLTKITNFIISSQTNTIKRENANRIIVGHYSPQIPNKNMRHAKSKSSRRFNDGDQPKNPIGTYCERG